MQLIQIVSQTPNTIVSSSMRTIDGRGGSGGLRIPPIPGILPDLPACPPSHHIQLSLILIRRACRSPAFHLYGPYVFVFAWFILVYDDPIVFHDCHNVGPTFFTLKGSLSFLHVKLMLPAHGTANSKFSLSNFPCLIISFVQLLSLQ